jgi:benzylsuccinate CoA-transferase BbsE subunit
MAHSERAALKGIRVLDLTENHAAYAGRLLADLGAEVIRVEPPCGSPVRQLAPSQVVRGGEIESYSHAFLDAGKLSVTLDPGVEAEQELFLRLAASSDVVIHTPSAQEPCDFPVAELRAANPNLIVASISPFGLTGPYAKYTAGELTMLAAGGLLSLGGYRDSEPIGIQGQQAQLGSGIFAAVAVLAVLYAREQTAEGAWIDVSGQECVAFALEDAVPEWYIAQRVRRRLGDGAREAGTGVYPCMDGYVSMVAGRLGTAKAFVALTRWIAESDVPGASLLLDPQWQDFRFRQSPEGIARFAEIFGAFCSTRSKQELYHEGQARQIAIAPVNTIADLFQDAQLRASNFFRTLSSAGDKLLFPGPPYRLSQTPARIRSVAPRLGEHNHAIIASELGVADAAGAVRPEPSIV